MANTNKALLAALLAIQKNIAIAIEEAGGGGITLPDTLDEINGLSKEDSLELCKTLHLDVEGLKTSQVKGLLTTARDVLDEADLSEQTDAVKALANACGIATKKRSEEDILTDIADYLKSGNSAEEETAEEEESEDEEKEESEDEETEEETEDEDEDEEAQAPKKKKAVKPDPDVDDEDEDEEKEEDEESEDEEKEEASEDEESGDDKVDRAAIAAKVKKLPKEAVMVERLTAYNKAAKKAEAEVINVKKLGTEKAYRALLAKLVDSEGNVAEWNTAYIANGAAYCCGLELAEVESEDAQRGKCVVSGKVWELDEADATFSEVEEED